MVNYDDDMNMEQPLEQSYTFRLFKQLPSFWSGFVSLINYWASLRLLSQLSVELSQLLTGIRFSAAAYRWLV
jgi:hypothetical protein